MPFRERTSTMLNRRAHGRSAETGDDLTRSPDQDAPDLVELAEAEAAEAEAIAAAARARARAIRLRQRAEAVARSENPALEAETEAEAAAAPEVADPTTAEDPGADPVEHAADDGKTPVADDGTAPVAEHAAARRRIGKPSRRRLTRVAVIAATVLIVAALAASGYMLWHHRQAVAETQRAAEYSAAARQGVVSLMSLDFNKAKEDVQRIIDNSTGRFREDFQAQAEEFASVAQESKVITEATVNSTAVQSMSGDSAVVLVAATSRITNTTGARQEPRTWRLSVELAREGDQIKMSRVEFVP